jgi:glycosyltransferase involved in cell wall biosynthesis
MKRPTRVTRGLSAEPPSGGFEIIVADGLSDDGTRDILARLSHEDARVRMVDAGERIGGSSWFSTGILMGANTRFQRERGVTDGSSISCTWRRTNGSSSLRWRNASAEAGPIDWLEQKGVEYLDLTRAGGGTGRGVTSPQAVNRSSALAGKVQQFDRADLALKTRVDACSSAMVVSAESVQAMTRVGQRGDHGDRRHGGRSRPARAVASRRVRRHVRPSALRGSSKCPG